MRSSPLRCAMFFAWIALGLGTTRAQEDVVQEESKILTVTYPQDHAMIVKNGRLVVLGTLNLAPGEAPPPTLVMSFALGSKIVASHSLRLNAEEGKDGVYEQKEGICRFAFKVRAPRKPDTYQLSVESISTVHPADGRTKIVRERSKRIEIEVE